MQGMLDQNKTFQ